jgi:hypothetical protein
VAARRVALLLEVAGGTPGRALRPPPSVRARDEEEENEWGWGLQGRSSVVLFARSVRTVVRCRSEVMDGQCELTVEWTSFGPSGTATRAEWWPSCWLLDCWPRRLCGKWSWVVFYRGPKARLRTVVVNSLFY